MSVFEKAFAKSDKTDAILVVDGKKMHVNKVLLSYHSDYFNRLFNSVSKEKSMKEVLIVGVNFEDFVTVLSLVHGAPIKYTYDQVESLLVTAERFQLPAAKRHVELFVLGQNNKNSKECALKWADTFKLNDLLTHVLDLYDYNSISGLSKNRAFLDELSNETIDQLFERMLNLKGKSNPFRMIRPPTMIRPPVDIYETAFAKSDKTDAILVVGEKKLHVNKSVLSHHSDYFNTLFNSNFKEKSMEEIEIKAVRFEDFVTLLSFYHLNPIIPTKENAEKILELADRFSLLSTKFYMEPCMIHFDFSSLEAIRIGEKYRLESLYQSGFDRLDIRFFHNLLFQDSYEELSTDTKRKFFDRFLKLRNVPNFESAARRSHLYGFHANRRTETPKNKNGFAKSDNTDAILEVQRKKLHVRVESKFAKTDKTDVVLVVDGKKLHINKALLSYHSDYFNTLFNSVSKEKSMEEVTIERVNFEDFAIVLSLVNGAPIQYTCEQVESLLEVADRFMLSAAKRHIELFILTQDIKDSKESALKWADTFKLNDLLTHVLDLYDYDSIFELPKNRDFIDKLSNETIVQLFERMLVIDEELEQYRVELLKSKRPSVDVYGAAFVKSDNTDAILVVGEKKLHVNKAVLSHHSDYFNTLFNSNFKEKSMEEIEIKDVNFKDFVTLLSFYHSNPIIPTKENAENILELADRFLLQSAKFYIEPWMIHFDFSSLEAIRIGEKYRLESLYQSGFDRLDNKIFDGLHANPSYQKLSSDAKRKIFNRYLERCHQPHSYY